MPRTKTIAPRQSREKGQRSLQLPDVFTRVLPQWRTPEWAEAGFWRQAVRDQPVASLCRDTLIANLISLDWKIEPRDSTERDEHKEDITYYTDFFEWDGKQDYTQMIEWIGGDALDIPFGAGMELGWERDEPRSKLLWKIPIDGSTLFPTLNDDWPVGQSLRERWIDAVYFPSHAINRLYYSPRREIKREGWGCAPPEKIYLALVLLSRGDYYYANLLLDTPEVGILDLGDIDEESAKEWIKSWQDLLGGIDPFKIPVLYQHEKPAQFISFTRSPTEILFNNTVTRYAAFVCAGYGISLSDIGLQAVSAGGETLAGTIRQERRARRTGLALLKKKQTLFFNRMLPPYLRFQFIDLDDELSVALGRARLANATAWAQLISDGVFSPSEARQQTMADGLTSISIPEEPPEDAVPSYERISERPSMLGRPVAPTAGGEGEVRKGGLTRLDRFDYFMDNVPEFREVVEGLEEKWDEFDLNTKTVVKEQMEDILTPSNGDTKIFV